MTFEEQQKRLYALALDYAGDEAMDDFFKRDVLSLVEKCTIELLEKEDSFFGMFLIQMKRVVSLKLPSPLATAPLNEGFVLYINPRTLLTCTKREMKALLKHEIYHIMYSHPQRIDALRNKYSLRAINIAMDISVNQYIRDLPPWSKRLDSINLEYNMYLEPNRTLEEYVEGVQKAIDALSDDKEEKQMDMDFELDMDEAHMLWLENADVTPEAQEALKKSTALNAYRGIVPMGLEEALAFDAKESEITWQQYINRVTATMKCGYKKTITRKDRRQPNRMDIKGILPKRIPKILVAIDISASMTDKELYDILVELYTLIKNYQAEIIVLECDEKIQRVYRMKSLRDIKKPLENKGATAFSPVFKYIKENNLKDYFLVYFTDGRGEEKLTEKVINSKTLWVLTGSEEKLSLKEYPGVVVNLTRTFKEDQESIYGIKVAKEMLKDWNIDTEANSIQSLRTDL